MATPRAHWARLVGLVAGVVALDQATKGIVVESIARGERNEVLPFLDLVHVRNDGIAFGFLGSGSQLAVLGVTAVALVAVMVWFSMAPERPLSWLAVGLLVGGAIGNLVDRITRDGVVDFIDFPAWPSFNVADIAITLGAVALALSAFVPADEDPDTDPPRGGGG